MYPTSTGCSPERLSRLELGPVLADEAVPQPPVVVDALRVAAVLHDADGDHLDVVADLHAARLDLELVVDAARVRHRRRRRLARLRRPTVRREPDADPGG